MTCLMNGVNKKKIAVIGCGTIATLHHIPSYMKNEKAEIKYFCDILLEKAQQAWWNSDYGGTAVTDYRQILNDPEIDAWCLSARPIICMHRLQWTFKGGQKCVV